MSRSLHLLAVLATAALALGARQPVSGAPPPTAPTYDCNGNGVEDSVDIALGSSADTNTDGVPDECQDLGVVAG